MMFRAAVLLLAVGSTSAFAPISTAKGAFIRPTAQLKTTTSNSPFAPAERTKARPSGDISMYGYGGFGAYSSYGPWAGGYGYGAGMMGGVGGGYGGYGMGGMGGMGMYNRGYGGYYSPYSMMGGGYGGYGMGGMGMYNRGYGGYGSGIFGDYGYGYYPSRRAMALGSASRFLGSGSGRSRYPTLMEERSFARRGMMAY